MEWHTLNDSARCINVVVQGWVNYYGRCFPSELSPLLRRINFYLARWAQRKYKRLGDSPARAWQLLTRVARREPRLFAHWRRGARPVAG